MQQQLRAPRAEPLSKPEFPCMTARQYVAALAKLGHTPSSGAVDLGISRRQSYRYADGTSPVPAWQAILLQRLLRLNEISPRPWPQPKRRRC